jgi:poly(hydroxyalkanoate) granule-associated protein
MARTARKSARAARPKQVDLVGTVKESARQVWMAGRGAFAQARKEGGKVVAALLREGEAIKTRTREAADGRIAAVQELTNERVGRMEKAVDQGIARTLAVIGVPSRAEVVRLEKRVGELATMVKQASSARARQVKAEKVAKVVAKAAKAVKAAPARKVAVPKKAVAKKPTVEPVVAVAPAVEAAAS